MKVKKYQTAIIIFALIAFISLAVGFGISMHMNDLDKAGSIGIIGGADGPTAIFISGSPLMGFITLAIVITLGMLLSVVYKKTRVKQ